MVTPALLYAAMPRAPVVWVMALLDAMPRFGIDTDHEVASFVAQLAHESCEFTRLEEDLNYSAERLMQVWPTRFPTLASAQPYARNRMRLANYVYANRNGNGGAETGDGWRFHGRGPTGLTFRDNYMACEAAIGEPIVAHPELLFMPPVGVRSACWFWQNKKLDRVDDDDSVLAETRAINGGTIGLKDRQHYFDTLMAAFTQGATV